MASTDEETGLTNGEKKFKEEPEEDLDPEKDPELIKNGGRFEKKKAILQVTWRFPVDFKDPFNIIALIYGYLPFVIPLVFFIDVVAEHRFIAFYALAVSGVVTLINEAILKEILKQPRPKGSANRKFNEKTKKWEMKPGMPSGHVLNATTTMVWCLLEVGLRGPGFDDHPLLTGKLLLLILLCMAPVPWARIYNQDHSLAQCTVAGVLGVFAGSVAYWVRYSYFPLEADKEYCMHDFCLYSGKPWDPFLPESDTLVAAAGTMTTVVTTTLKEGLSSLATAAAGDKLKVEETPGQTSGPSADAATSEETTEGKEKRKLRGPEFKRADK
mmetsp:Transcript_45146/g.55285  ORF Transcript_45146/g.55285 Transcript_45146/m.55285 type:complete len:327 (+) Transcript_45146:59-1039(+)